MPMHEQNSGIVSGLADPTKGGSVSAAIALLMDPAADAPQFRTARGIFPFCRMGRRGWQHFSDGLLRRLIQRTHHAKPVRTRRHVQVNLRRRDVLVAQQFLNGPQVHAAF
jgi:hypothetical protein